jgi:hypothetical protein
MKLKIIETADYVLTVSDEEIINASYIYNSALNIVEKNTEFNNGILQSRIIAYQPKGNAKELDLPLLPETVIEEDVEKLMYDAIQKARGNDFQTFYKLAAKNCYEVHKSATKVYSEEDLRKAFMQGNHGGVTQSYLEFEDYIQSLKQPKTPKWFVAEMEITKSEVFRDNDNIPYAVLKTTTINGKEYLVGTYLYE